MSFEAPVAHFGLDEAEAVDRLIIEWVDGSVSEIEQRLEAGATYVVRRRSVTDHPAREGN